MKLTAKKTDRSHVPLPSDAGGGMLHFLTRTLQAHCRDSDPQIVLEKLKTLQSALDRQEVTLAHWPDSPSKHRICEDLGKAKTLVAQFVDEFGTAAQKRFAHGDDAKAV
jgi:hypothetical protein